MLTSRAVADDAAATDPEMRGVGQDTTQSELFRVYDSPREVYQAPYRNLIDWSRFPDWARPSDPEMFEGSGHEG